MSTKLMTLGCALLAVGTLCAFTSLSSVLFSDDFASGTDSNWAHVDLLTPLGGTHYDASSGRYELSSNFPLPPLPFQVFSGSALPASVGDPLYENVVLSATIRFNNANSNVAIAARADFSQAASGIVTGFAFASNNITDEISIGRVDASGGFPPSSITTLAVTSFAFTEGVDYNVEGRLTGNRISMKVWTASGNKPNQPQLAVNDGTYKHDTGVAVAVYSTIGVGGQLSGSVDNVVVTSMN